MQLHCPIQARINRRQEQQYFGFVRLFLQTVGHLSVKALLKRVFGAGGIERNRRKTVVGKEAAVVGKILRERQQILFQRRHILYSGGTHDVGELRRRDVQKSVGPERRQHFNGKIFHLLVPGENVGGVVGGAQSLNAGHFYKAARRISSVGQFFAYAVPNATRIAGAKRLVDVEIPF